MTITGSAPLADKASWCGSERPPECGEVENDYLMVEVPQLEGGPSPNSPIWLLGRADEHDSDAPLSAGLPAAASMLVCLPLSTLSAWQCRV